MRERSVWVPIGEFTRGIGMGDRIRFIVERSSADHDRHRIACDEGNGPREVCTFTEPLTQPTRWRPAWDGDSMSPGIETEARKIAHNT